MPSHERKANLKLAMVEQYNNIATGNINEKSL